MITMPKTAPITPWVERRTANGRDVTVAGTVEERIEPHEEALQRTGLIGLARRPQQQRAHRRRERQRDERRDQHRH